MVCTLLEFSVSPLSSLPRRRAEKRAHHAQQRHALWKIEGENVSSGEAAQRSLRRTHAFARRLRTGQLRASFLERCAALWQQHNGGIIRSWASPHP
jgi:hypothetical protein